MKSSRCSEEQIIGILKEHQARLGAKELCRKHGISEASFYKRHFKYGCMDASLMSRMKELNEENKRFKQLSAKKRIQNDLLKEALGKTLRQSRRREMAEWAVRCQSASIAMACLAFQTSEACYQNRQMHSHEHEFLADWPVALTKAKKKCGFDRFFLHLRNVQGFGRNHKRVYRIFRELELARRIKPH